MLLCSLFALSLSGSDRDIVESGFHNKKLVVLRSFFTNQLIYKLTCLGLLYMLLQNRFGIIKKSLVIKIILDKTVDEFPGFLQ